VTDLAAVVLAAGSGTRLRPLTELLPKALCPVNNKALVDHALDSVELVASRVAVNAWHKSGLVVEHLQNRVHMSVEEAPLGTAGALGNLRDWLGSRNVLVHNADSWHRAELPGFVRGWDGERVRLLVKRNLTAPDFGDWRFCGVSLMPNALAKTFEAVPTGLWEVSWAKLAEQGLLDLVYYDGPFFDCGTHEDYLEANLMASEGRNVVAPDAVVEGDITQCVVWSGAKVASGETLERVIRAPGVSIQC
jgi:N-acetyl-alpha-D-muramate 1-phosphate uridylyltransferase